MNRAHCWQCRHHTEPGHVEDGWPPYCGRCRETYVCRECYEPLTADLDCSRQVRPGRAACGRIVGADDYCAGSDNG